MYPVPVGNSKCRALMIQSAMRKIWGVDFEPTVEWVERIRAEVIEMREARKAEADETRRIERQTVTTPQEPRFCKDCGEPLSDGYWWRCPSCWEKIRSEE
jgi:lipopolysaccharide biosynthesis regulator YciM